MSDGLTRFITVIVTIFLITALLFGARRCSINQEEKLWNNGHCDVCGGTWKYEQAVGHRSDTSYIYVCEDCGKRIEIYEEK